MRTTGSALAGVALLLLQNTHWVAGDVTLDASERDAERLEADALAAKLSDEGQQQTSPPAHDEEETAKWLAYLKEKGLYDEGHEGGPQFDNLEPDSEEEYPDPDDVAEVDEDDEDAAAHDEQRRLQEEEESAPDPVEEVEEEVVEEPLIPGVRDADLAAFNAEFAKRDVLEKVIAWSYDQTAEASPHRDNFVHADDLYEFLLHTLNPQQEQIEDEDHELLEEAARVLRKQQGLVDDDMVVHRGFIARGMPLRFLQSVAHDIHHHIRSRRLQATDGHHEL